VQALCDLVIGCGVQTFAWPFLPWETMQIVEELESVKEGVLMPRLKYALESDDLWEEWWNDPKQVDVEGKRSGPELQRDLFRECVQVGHGLLIRVTPDGPGYRVPLAFQMVEREQLDPSKDGERDGVRIVGGIEINRAGRPIAYHILDAHPHDVYQGATTTGSTRIPADRVIDLCLWHRPSAAIGCTWLDAVGQKDFDRDSFLDAEIKVAAKGALLALIHKSENAHLATTLGLLDDDSETTDDYGNEEVKLGTTPIAARVGINESVEMVESKRPTSSANNFFRLLDQDIAAGAGISYYTLTGDYAATSFSSTRAAKMDEDLHVLPLQQWFSTHVALPIRKQFNIMAAMAGQFESVRPGEFRRNERRLQRFDAIGPGRDLLDPGKETDAKIARMRSGLSTLKYECARQGQHWIRQLMQQGLEGALAELFGATIDWSNGGGVSRTEIEQRQGKDADAQPDEAKDTADE
jgi:lambda family phage portal protein